MCRSEKEGAPAFGYVSATQRAFSRAHCKQLPFCRRRPRFPVISRRDNALNHFARCSPSRGGGARRAHVCAPSLVLSHASIAGDDGRRDSFPSTGLLLAIVTRHREISPFWDHARRTGRGSRAAVKFLICDGPTARGQSTCSCFRTPAAPLPVNTDDPWTNDRFSREVTAAPKLKRSYGTKISPLSSPPLPPRSDPASEPTI